MSVASSTTFPAITFANMSVTESQYFPADSRPEGTIAYKVIDSRIGEGTFGRIYKVTANGETFAWKCTRTLQTLGEKRFKQAREDIVRESGFLQELKGRANIIQLVATFTVSSCGPTMLLEYHGEGDLRSYNEHRLYLGFSVKQVSSVMQGVKRALQACKECEIIHRDVKPPNLLIKSISPSEVNTALADFGLAVKKNGEKVSIDGTLDFISHEIAQSVEDDAIYDYPSDMWSLGCTLIELLQKYSDNPIFYVQGFKGLKEQHKKYLIEDGRSLLKGVMENIRERKCSTPEEWAEFRVLQEEIEKMLEIDPKKRLKPGEEAALLKTTQVPDFKFDEIYRVPESGVVVTRQPEQAPM